MAARQRLTVAPLSEQGLRPGLRPEERQTGRVLQQRLVRGRPARDRGRNHQAGGFRSEVRPGREPVRW